jgi:hypothetical protein
MKGISAETGRFFMAGCAAICGCLVLVAFLYSAIPVKNKKGSACRPPVGDFSEASLVGTWVHGGPKHNDKLIIKANGTYKQIVHAEPPDFPSLDYEGDWKPWHLESSIDKPPYLHLTGFAFCGIDTGISCDVHDSGGYDFCQDKTIPMKDEGILLVLETLRYVPSQQEQKYGYLLYFPLGSENTYVYHLQAP